MKVDGFDNFKQFRRDMMLEMDDMPDMARDRGLHKDESKLLIWPVGGGVIILKDDGTWDFDVAPFH